MRVAFRGVVTHTPYSHVVGHSRSKHLLSKPNGAVQVFEPKTFTVLHVCAIETQQFVHVYMPSCQQGVQDPCQGCTVYTVSTRS